MRLCFPWLWRTGISALAIVGLVNGSPEAGAGDRSGNSVVVIYNKNLPDSKELAEYYAERRKVPSAQLVGLDLPVTEVISRAEYRRNLEEPLLRSLVEKRIFQFNGNLDDGLRGTSKVLLTNATIRFAALCYGVPVKIADDPKLEETGSEKIRLELRRNEAAVDSELALLPQLNSRLYGVVPNPLYGATNAAFLHPTNGLLLVSRLDGPSIEIARGLIDKAAQAERDGLWGRAYFDARGITDGSYKLGDDWIQGAAEMARRLGFETVLDKQSDTFSRGFPMSQIAIYAGWYDAHVSGPFTFPEVEFMPGAVAYHLHSFSAQSIRTTNRFWAGPLLAKGATATMGCVSEPYLEGTPDIHAFLGRFVYAGLTLAESAFTAQRVLSWQTTVLGDPLYAPFARPVQEQHRDLLARSSELVAWSHLRLVNLNLENGIGAPQLIAYLKSLPQSATNSVLLEKLADLYRADAQFQTAIDTYQRALKQETTPMERVRITLALAAALDLYDENDEAIEVYEKFLQEHPEYADKAVIFQRLVSLANEMGRAELGQKYQGELDKLAGLIPSK